MLSHSFHNCIGTRVTNCKTLTCHTVDKGSSTSCTIKSNVADNNVIFCFVTGIFRSLQDQLATGKTLSEVVVAVAGKLQSKTFRDKGTKALSSADGKILKCSTSYIKDDDGSLHYVFGINYDITKLTLINSALDDLITPKNKEEKPKQITHSVNDLLDRLIEESVKLVGKPVALMNKEDKVTAIQFLNDSGAFLITKSGDKVANYFGISKYTLYSYIDVNK